MKHEILEALIETWSIKLAEMKFVDGMSKTETARGEGEYICLKRCLQDLIDLLKVFNIKH